MTSPAAKHPPTTPRVTTRATRLCLGKPSSAASDVLLRPVEAWESLRQRGRPRISRDSHASSGLASPSPPSPRSVSKQSLAQLRIRPRAHPHPLPRLRAPYDYTCSFIASEGDQSFRGPGQPRSRQGLLAPVQENCDRLASPRAPRSDDPARQGLRTGSRCCRPCGLA